MKEVEARVRQQLQLRRHEYLRDSLEWNYHECVSCYNRSQFTCMKCGFCYSCHSKKEELEKTPSYIILSDE